MSVSNLKKLVISSVLLVGDAIGQKLVGLISTIILARILVPEDFGIIAIALIFLGLTQVLSNTGSLQYLLKAKKINAEIVNTAWTISLYTKMLIALSFCLLAYPISIFYGDSRLTLVIIALMVVFIIQAFRNPAEAYLKRAQTYQKIVILNLLCKVFAVAAAISVALIYESYWALVAGQFIAATIGTIGSFFIKSHRLKLTLSDVSSQWAFSKWMIPQSLFGYFRTQLDTILVSVFYGRAELGSFHTMKYLAYLPSANFLVPAMQPLLVELSHFKNDKLEYSKRFNSSFFVPFLVSIPITAILFLYGDLFTLVVLGSQWTEYSSILSFFALLIPANIIFQTCARTLIIYGHSKHLLIAEVIMFMLIYVTLLGTNIESIKQFTIVRALMENVLCMSLMILISVLFTSKLSTVRLIITITLLIIATLPTFYLVEFIPMQDSPLVSLIIKSFSFSIVYFAIILLIYFALKRYMADWYYTAQLLKKIMPLKKI